jgi:hypothetical protein
VLPGPTSPGVSNRLPGDRAGEPLNGRSPSRSFRSCRECVEELLFAVCARFAPVVIQERSLEPKAFAQIFCPKMVTTASF